MALGRGTNPYPRASFRVSPSQLGSCNTTPDTNAVGRVDIIGAEPAAATVGVDQTPGPKLTIITGQGHHSRVQIPGSLKWTKGESEVKHDVTAFLEELGSPFKAPSDNPGCLRAGRAAVYEWLGGLGPVEQRMCVNDAQGKSRRGQREVGGIAMNGVKDWEATMAARKEKNKKVRLKRFK
jgi:hypothetical protein